MEFAELGAAGVDVTPGLNAIYQYALELWDRPIDFDLIPSMLAPMAACEFIVERVQIWLKQTAADPVTTLIQRARTLVIAGELHPPRLTPEAQPARLVWSCRTLYLYLSICGFMR